MIRVLVADDSPTVRTLLVQILNDDPEIRVVGEARNGDEAVALAESLRPDLVTMDVHMPGMDGLTATKEIMIRAPTPIVIVTSSARSRDVEASLATLRIGALDLLQKPSSPAAPDFEATAKRLVAAVKAMSQVKVVRHWRQGPSPAPTPRVPPSTAPGTPAELRARVVAIASSTGGPAALQQVLSALPAGFAAPILVVQHITSGFTSGLARWLDSSCTLRVKVAEADEALAPGTVYIAPDDRHLGASDKATVVLSGTAPVGGFRPSGTFLFESVARAFGASALAVILTGMGDDGVLGLHAVRKAGGRVIAQDEPSSVIFGMPRAAVEAGLANLVLPIDAVAPRLLALV